MSWVSAIATLASTIAAAFSAYFAWQAVKTSTDERRNQRDDACRLQRPNCSQPYIDACRLSGAKREREIWPAYTDASNQQRRFRSVYGVARRYHAGLAAGVPEKIEQLLVDWRRWAKGWSTMGMTLTGRS